jgi:hypothetical protein
MRARELRSSSTRARRSAFRRALSIASAAAEAGPGPARRGVELGVVHGRRDAAAVALDGGPRAAGAGVRQLDRAAVVVDEDAPVGQPGGANVSRLGRGSDR